jgi:hypothetical protein
MTPSTVEKTALHAFAKRESKWLQQLVRYVMTSLRSALTSCVVFVTFDVMSVYSEVLKYCSATSFATFITESTALIRLV